MVEIKYNLDSGVRTRQKFKISTKSTLSLIVANLLTIITALWQEWELTDLMWVYWLQSVIIGYFQQKKIRDLEKFSTDRFMLYGHDVEPTVKTKNNVATLFTFHYGLFHLAYLLFLFSSGLPNFIWILPLGLVFFINHYFSYLENRGFDKKRVKNIGEMMFFPYLRIIPMHLTIILGQAIWKDASLIGFLLLKTSVDTIMHVVEHSRNQRAKLHEFVAGRIEASQAKLAEKEQANTT